MREQQLALTLTTAIACLVIPCQQNLVFPLSGCDVVKMSSFSTFHVRSVFLGDPLEIKLCWLLSFDPITIAKVYGQDFLFRRWFDGGIHQQVQWLPLPRFIPMSVLIGLTSPHTKISHCCTTKSIFYAQICLYYIIFTTIVILRFVIYHRINFLPISFITIFNLYMIHINLHTYHQIQFTSNYFISIFILHLHHIRYVFYYRI